jgi:RNA polymerase sigma factor (TIGR02999 family)
MDPSPAGRVSRILAAASEGEAKAAEELLPLVYDELRALARRQLAAEPRGQTLQATALVHEAYLRLVKSDPVDWEGRRHFFGAAAQAMRRILIERARRRAAAKHGGGRDRITLDDIGAAQGTAPIDLLALHEALARLERRDPRMGEIVMLRFFAGLGVEETAAALGLSPRTVKRDWAVARAWLFEEMSGKGKTRDGR